MNAGWISFELRTTTGRVFQFRNVDSDCLCWIMVRNLARYNRPCVDVWVPRVYGDAGYVEWDVLRATVAEARKAGILQCKEVREPPAGCRRRHMLA